ncbi:DUF418 domain-containing protein [Aliiglaciecola litoralis]|uniref:DUF418 domain-containing protein n=2 Tax=Aliiglaciecola litoralis TaxID=582857 RepID=A0ABN1LTQ1_9ALTE
MEKQHRIVSLDVLRGISLFFILIANVLVFSGYYFLDESLKQQYATYDLDAWLFDAIKILVEAKFYTLFSLLFGIGFYIQLQRFKSSSSFPKYMLRRMSILLLIGLVHMFFIWLGDILALYAILGMVLILFHKWSDRKLLIMAISLLILPILHVAFMQEVGVYLGGLFGQFNAYVYSLDGAPPKDPNVFVVLEFTRTQDWQFYWQVKLVDPVIRLAILIADTRFFKVLGIFMIGLVIGRHIFHHGLLENTRLLKRTLFWGFIIGLPANIGMTILSNAETNSASNAILHAVLGTLGIVPLTLAYAAGIVLMLNNGGRWLLAFAFAGRMALTNYIMQSIICITLFYGIGLGWAGRFGLLSILLIVTLIFLFQILFSFIYLRYVNQGPLEYLWRMSIQKHK